MPLEVPDTSTWRSRNRPGAKLPVTAESGVLMQMDPYQHV